MRKLGIFSVLVLLLFSGLKGQAKVPGFLGKRHLFQAQMNVIPALWDTEITYVNYKSGATKNVGHLSLNGLNKSYSLSYQYVLGKKFSMGPEVLFYRKAIAGESHLRNFGHPVLRHKTMGLGLDFRFTPFIIRGNIAPLGTFFHLKVMGFNSKSYKSIQSSSNEPITNGELLKEQLSMSVHLGMGRTWAITNSLFFQAGFEFGRNSLYYKYYFRNNFEKEYVYHFQYFQNISAYFGITFLPF